MNSRRILGACIFLFGLAGLSSHALEPDLSPVSDAPCPMVARRPLGRGVPLSGYLNADGTLNLPPRGISGSLDPAGFELVSEPGEPPRFEVEHPERAGPDDAWDARFALRGMNSYVMALAWDGTNLYAGGDFTSAGGVPANYVAKWNGTTWSALGSGVDYRVTSLVWGGTNLYVGGGFTTAGGVVANGIARWNGTAWSALGTGMDGGGYVDALAWDGSNLYAGGSFPTAGGLTVNYVAKWNGSSWSALGSGMGNGVRALLWSGTRLYAGGDFTDAGGVPAEHVAQWNGTSWSPLGLGTDFTVHALAWDGANL